MENAMKEDARFKVKKINNAMFEMTLAVTEDFTIQIKCTKQELKTFAYAMKDILQLDDTFVSVIRNVK
jgi:hypothetical protein